MSSDGCPDDCSICRDDQTPCIYTNKNKECSVCGRGLEMECNCKVREG